MNILFLYIINHLQFYFFNIEIRVIIDNKSNSLLLKDVKKLEYKLRIKIFINFKIEYYYSEHERSLCFVKRYLIPFIFVSQLCHLFFFF